METPDETFDAQAEVARIRSRRAVARRKHYRKSRLDRYRTELVAMRRAGASCADLAEWFASVAAGFTVARLTAI